MPIVLLFIALALSGSLALAGPLHSAQYPDMTTDTNTATSVDASESTEAHVSSAFLLHSAGRTSDGSPDTSAKAHARAEANASGVLQVGL